MRRWVRNLTSTAVAAAVAAVMALTLGLFTPAQAGTVHVGGAVASATAVPVPTASTSTAAISATSVPQTQQEISGLLAADGASSAFPAVDAAITPPLQSAVAAGGGQANSDTLKLPFHITINCTITFPPLQIKCTVQITFTP